MKVGIDSYSCHRFFGEVYPQQRRPDRLMTAEEFIEYARSLGVDGVSLESCFLPSVEPSYLAELRGMLDSYNLDRVYAWGHPDGLEGGTNEAAYGEMIRSFEHARAIGANVMRVVGSSLRFRNEPHAPQLERLTRMFRKAVRVAEEYGIRMAVENHIDFNGQEMLVVIAVRRLTFSRNKLRYRELCPSPGRSHPGHGDACALHVCHPHQRSKNSARSAGEEWYFFSSAPVGDGVVDNAKLIEKLLRTGFNGILAVEIDFLHPDYGNDELAALAQSVNELRRLVAQVEVMRNPK